MSIPADINILTAPFAEIYPWLGEIDGPVRIEPVDDAALPRALQLLSLGIDVDLAVGPSTPLTERLRGLVTYAFYSTLPVGRLEPFASLAESYDPDAFAGFDGSFSREKWERRMIGADRCSFCGAMRLCGGFFEAQAERGDCRPFAEELLETVEFYKDIKSGNCNL